MEYQKYKRSKEDNLKEDYSKKDKLKNIPKIQKILDNPKFAGFNKIILKNITTRKINKIREQILQDKVSCSIDFIINDIALAYKEACSCTLKSLINATGVVLQTNLGRSIFDKNLLNEIIPLLSHYNNLEYNLKDGKRGERYEHISNMFCSVFNIEDILIVNNNAAAVFLILNTFAKNKEAILSRGELVEIGGSFRIPEIMNSSGAKLIEVGTTNKTKLEDYKNAINESSAIIMKVHKSNFEILGFKEEVLMKDLSKIGKDFNLIDYYDLGSGYFKGIECSEPSILEICKDSPSLLSFSGDKLFGATQAGIILGKRDLIKQLKQNPLLRAFRVDKITILILQATLKRYIDNNLNEIPTLKMLSFSQDELKNKAQNLASQIDDFFNPKVIKIFSLAGGGSLPNQEFESYGISLECEGFRALDLEKLLREYLIIARIFANKVTFDLRTIQDDEFENIVKILRLIKETI